MFISWQPSFKQNRSFLGSLAFEFFSAFLDLQWKGTWLKWNVTAYFNPFHLRDNIEPHFLYFLFRCRSSSRDAFPSCIKYPTHYKIGHLVGPCVLTQHPTLGANESKGTGGGQRLERWTVPYSGLEIPPWQHLWLFMNLQHNIGNGLPFIQVSSGAPLYVYTN